MPFTKALLKNRLQSRVRTNYGISDFCLGSWASTYLSDFWLIGGWQIAPLKEKNYLYADYTLLYLSDADSFIRAAQAIIDEFGHYPGVRMKWNKSVLFPLDPKARDSVAHTPLLWVDKFKYLGIRLTSDVSITILILNLYCYSWGSCVPREITCFYIWWVALIY